MLVIQHDGFEIKAELASKESDDAIRTLTVFWDIQIWRGCELLTEVRMPGNRIHRFHDLLIYGLAALIELPQLTWSELSGIMDHAKGFSEDPYNLKGVIHDVTRHFDEGGKTYYVNHDLAYDFVCGTCTISRSMALITDRAWRGRHVIDYKEETVSLEESRKLKKIYSEEEDRQYMNFMVATPELWKSPAP